MKLPPIDTKDIIRYLAPALALLGILIYNNYNTIKLMNINNSEPFLTIINDKANLIMGNVGFMVIFIVIVVALCYVARIYANDSNIFDNLSDYKTNILEARNEPYLIKYTNTYKTNLKSINFNFRRIYDGGNNIPLYIKNKLNELLIGKYVKFHNVLTFKQNIFQPKLITDFQFYSNHLFLPTASIKGNYVDGSNTCLFITKKDVLEFPVYPLKTPLADQKDIRDNTDKTKNLKENYLYVFEKVDLDS